MDDFIRRFLGMGPGAKSRPGASNSYGYPNIDENRQDHDVFMDRGGSFGPHGSSLDDMFDHFHRDMFQQMESLHRQMEDMFKGFGAMDFPSAGDFSPSIVPNDPKNEDAEGRIFTWSSPSPFFRHGSDHSKKSPRDFMLKEGDKENDKSETQRAKLKEGPKLDVPRWDKFGPGKMEDTDLDGKISDENVLALIKRPEEGSIPDVATRSSVKRPSSFFSSQSVSISTFNGPDGKVEQKRVVRDSSGREESSITRSIGDKSHTVTTVRDDSGSHEKHENLQNMDEGDLGKFEEMWSKPRHESPLLSPGDPMLSPRSPSLLPVDPQDQSLFERLFGGRVK